MSEPRPWRLLSTRTVLEDRWLRIDAERLETDNGHIIDPWYIAHGQAWACAVALTPDRQVVMVEQYRRGVDRFQVGWHLIDRDVPDALLSSSQVDDFPPRDR